MTKNRLATRTASFAVLAALAAFGLVACGSDPSSSAEPGSNAGSNSSDGSASGLACPEGKLAAEGSSAQGNAITEVIASYNAECGDKASIEYNPTGSGAGIKSFYNGLVDFAGSDSALKTEEKDGVVEADKAKERCQGNPAWNLPMVDRPDRLCLQHRRRRQTGAERRGPRRYLQRQHQDLGRREDRETQQRRPAAWREDHRLLPLG